ncbi:hypothetical protein [Gloeobacter kilaueensis]|nr:hypothetical protein [Gloeobacter kilaueensis]
MPTEAISFAQAIERTTALLDEQAAGQRDAEKLYRAVADLVATANGARGFFVTFLSGEWPIADALPDGLVEALRTAPAVVAPLMTKNLAMSTAMIWAHRQNGDAEAASGSEQVARRSAALIARLQLPQIEREIAELKRALTDGQGDYAAFLDRWGYTEAQRAAIKEAIEPFG